MMPLKAELMNLPYELIRVDTFEKNLKEFKKINQQKILVRVKDWLGNDPYRYEMLKGAIVVSGKKLFGLRHIKIGVEGYKGGAYVLYRICEECLKYEYWKKSNIQCLFCDSDKPKRIVLFDVQTRGFDYGR